MEKLPQEQREAIKKLSTERLRSRLVKLGFDEELIFSTGRDELLVMLAESMINPPPPPGAVAEPKELVEVRMKELSIKEQELRLREIEIKAAAEQHAARLAVEREQHAAQLAAEKEHREMGLKAQAEQHAAELELRRQELALHEMQSREEMDLRQAEMRRLRTRDEQVAERESSFAAQTKRYGDILKHVLPRMPSDPGELMNFWDTCENIMVTV